MNSRLFILGAGGHGKVVADIALKLKKYDQIFFLDDKPSFKMWKGIEVLGNSQFQKFEKDDEIIVAIGNAEIREKKQEHYERLGVGISTLIHPNAVIGSDVVVEKGSVVMAGAIINSSTLIRKGCIINTGATVDHDNRIGEYSHVSIGSHLAGTVKVGKHVWIGAGAIVINNILICDKAVIGAGAVVVKDIKEKGVYIGIPARRR